MSMPREQVYSVTRAFASTRSHAKPTHTLSTALSSSYHRVGALQTEHLAAQWIDSTRDDPMVVRLAMS